MPFNCHGSRCQESRDKQALGNPKSKRWNRNLNLDDAIPTVIFFTRTPIHEMVLRTGVFWWHHIRTSLRSLFVLCCSSQKSLCPIHSPLRILSGFHMKIRRCGVRISGFHSSRSAGFQHQEGAAFFGGRHGGLLTFASADLRFFLVKVIVKMLMSLWFNQVEIEKNK